MSVFRIARAIVVFPLALVALGCGGGDDGEPAGAAQTTTAEVTTETGDVASGDSVPVTGVGDLAEAIGGDELTDAIDALGIETRISIVADQLGGDYEITGENSATLVLDGDAETDSIMACIVASAVSSENDVITVRYPNGEVVCD